LKTSIPIYKVSSNLYLGRSIIVATGPTVSPFGNPRLADRALIWKYHLLRSLFCYGDNAIKHHMNLFFYLRL